MQQLFILLGGSLLAVMAGLSFVMQQAVNVNLRASLGSAAWAGFVSYVGGSVCMLVIALALRDPTPHVGVIVKSNWWAWTGGLFGAIYIGIAIMLVPRLGTAAFVTLLVAGQMLASLVFDHYGLFGLPRHPVDLYRILGAALLVGGVVLVRL